MRTRVKSFLAFWYDFIVGDDWTIAAAVIVALVVTKLLVLANVGIWWLLPIVVVLMLAASVFRVAQASR